MYIYKRGKAQSDSINHENRHSFARRKMYALLRMRQTVYSSSLLMLWAFTARTTPCEISLNIVPQIDLEGQFSDLIRQVSMCL